MTTPIWQVDAFADQPFTGNPAAVCIVDAATAEDRMLAIVFCSPDPPSPHCEAS